MPRPSRRRFTGSGGGSAFAAGGGGRRAARGLASRPAGGEPEWEETVKLPGGERKVRISPGLASPILVDGRCLMLGDSGHLVWLDLNPKEYRELDRARLFLAGETWSMPALSRGLLYVCQNE